MSWKVERCIRTRSTMGCAQSVREPEAVMVRLPNRKLWTAVRSRVCTMSWVKESLQLSWARAIQQVPLHRNQSSSSSRDLSPRRPFIVLTCYPLERHRPPTCHEFRCAHPPAFFGNVPLAPASNALVSLAGEGVDPSYTISTETLHTLEVGAA
jgi:hypothetical protein